jgi:acylphosphatase
LSLRHNNNDVSLKYRVHGRVQGVFFRASTKQQADVLGISGWVRNSDDGDVEGLASGSKEQLQSFKEWLSHGPRMARVEKLQIEDSDYEAFEGFTIR